jgi:hypothetical protein
MNITNITQFKNDVYAFYLNILNSTIITYPLDEFGGTPDPSTGQYDNIVALRTQLQTECNKIVSSYNGYLGALNGTTKTKFENALLMIVAYVGAKFGTIIDEVKYPQCAITT